MHTFVTVHNDYIKIIFYSLLLQIVPKADGGKYIITTPLRLIPMAKSTLST